MIELIHLFELMLTQINLEQKRQFLNNMCQNITCTNLYQDVSMKIFYEIMYFGT